MPNRCMQFQSISNRVEIQNVKEEQLLIWLNTAIPVFNIKYRYHSQVIQRAYYASNDNFQASEIKHVSDQFKRHHCNSIPSKIWAIPEKMSLQLYPHLYQIEYTQIKPVYWEIATAPFPFQAKIIALYTVKPQNPILSIQYIA